MTPLQDPLSTTTRRERRNLIVVSAIGLAMVKAGLIPNSINALGIGIDKLDQGALLFIVGFTNLYLLLAFVIYGTSDFLAWYRSLLESRLQEFQGDHNELVRRSEVRARPIDLSRWSPPPVETLDELRDSASSLLTVKARIAGVARPTHFVSIVRCVFEFGLPMALGAYSTFELLTSAGGA